MKDKIILIGGGGHCKSCIDVIEEENKFEIIGIIDTLEKVGKYLLNYPIIGTDEDILNYSKIVSCFLITVGQIKTPEKRMKLYVNLKDLGFKPAIVISSHSYVSKHSKIGEGTIIMHGATINAGAQIGSNCIINSHALIEHDAIIESHCHISTGAVINGDAYIGTGTFIGSQAMIREGLKIPDYSVIIGGAAVFKI
ncbi:MAG: NeuD/PglB/VioB family sugar acetyltransferase [Desulfobacterales bacterium]|nr:NeuD/PglB/VioB family sugar acetyltransferase [Desulfobacterales bacterium]